MTCNCTLHPRRDHKDPCRACASKHVRLTRTTAERTSPFAGQAGLEDSRRSSEGPDLSRPALASAGSRVPTRSMPVASQPFTGAVERVVAPLASAPAPVSAGRRS